MAVYEQRFYKTVASTTTDTDEYVIPSGGRVAISKMGGDAVFSEDVGVEIIWDPDGTPELIFATAGSTVQDSVRQLIGDGTKKICIKLRNDSAQQHVMGGFILGEEYAS